MGKIHFARIHGGDFARIQNGEFARNVSLNLVSEIKLMGTAFAPKLFFPLLPPCLAAWLTDMCNCIHVGINRGSVYGRGHIFFQ